MQDLQTFLFFVFSAITLLSAFMVIMSRNTITGAMFMILSFIGTAGLFILLEAYFIAVLEVLVYAGAVMVLFLFIVMLINTEKYAKRLPNKGALISSTIAILALLITGTYLIAPSTDLPSPELIPAQAMLTDGAQTLHFTTSTKSYGYLLFSKYMLPVQMTGILLLIAMVGVVILSKRYTEPENPQTEASS